MFNLIVTALLPVFLVLALGYFAGRRKLVDNQNVSSLNVLLMQFALPLTLFISIAKTPQSVIMQNGQLALLLALGLVIVYAIVGWMHRTIFGLSLSDAAVQTLTIAFPNFASIGLPLVLPIFGQQASLSVAIAIAVGSVTISPMTLALLDLDKARQTDAGHSVSAVRQFLIALGHSVRKPIFVGPMLGLIVALLGISLPTIVATALGPITAATAGIGLFLTGLMLSAQVIKIDADVTFGTVVKNIVQPLLVFGLARLFHFPATIAGQAALLTAIPAGFFGLVFGASSGVRPPVAGATLLVSSISSVVTLSIAIWLLAPK